MLNFVKNTVPNSYGVNNIFIFNLNSLLLVNNSIPEDMDKQLQVVHKCLIDLDLNYSSY